MTHVFDKLAEIADTPGKHDKQALVAAGLKDGVFKAVVCAALNPFVTYGMDKLPLALAGSVGGKVLTTSDSIWDILNQMAARTLTGSAAALALIEHTQHLDPKSCAVIGYIIKKDVRAGFTLKTVNKAEKNLIPVFEVMLAHPYEEKRIKSWPQIAEVKYDGVRVVCFVPVAGTASDVKFYSRTGKEFTSFDNLKGPVLDMMTSHAQAYSGLSTVPPRLAKLHEQTWVLDGEVVSGSFNKTVSEVRKKDTAALDAQFIIFDALTLEEFESSKSPKFRQRREDLVHLHGVKPTGQIHLSTRYLVNSHDEIMDIYQRLHADGAEGLIVKNMDAIYERKRSYAWMKIKGQESVDVPVIGAFEGEGKYEGMLGGLITNLDGVDVRVGGGFSDAQRVSFWDAFIKDRDRVHGSDEEFLLLSRLIEVEYHERTPDGSLRHPRFVRFRADKEISA